MNRFRNTNNRRHEDLRKRSKRQWTCLLTQLTPNRGQLLSVSVQCTTVSVSENANISEMRFVWCLSVLVIVTVIVSSAHARRSSGGGRPSGNRLRGVSRPRATRAPVRPIKTPRPHRPHNSVNSHFLDSERAATTNTKTTHKPPLSVHETNPILNPNHGVPGYVSSAQHTPNLPKQNNTKEPIGFERITSDVRNNTNNMYTPSAPPLPIGFPNVNQQTGTVGQHQSVHIQPGGFNQTVNQINQHSGYPVTQINQQSGYLNQHGTPPIPQGGYSNQPGVQQTQQGGYLNQYGTPPFPQGGYTNQPGVQPNQQSGYLNQYGTPPFPQGGYINQPGFQPNQPGNNHFSHSGSLVGQPKPPTTYGTYQNAYYLQPALSNTGQGYQPNLGYSNGYLGQYQGSYQGFGTFPRTSYGNSNPWGSSPGSNVYSYGGSSFVQSNPYGGNPFAYTSNNLGSGGYVNPYYNPNTFGYSNNPGFFGYQSTYPGYSGTSTNYGEHKKSRFSGLPIPIPIPIPIPVGGFGNSDEGYGYIHRLLDGFLKNKTISTSNNETTSVFILNNSTITPCTTDLFIYDSLNVTVTSCTAANCTAIKITKTTNVSGEVTIRSAGITMCLEPNATYSIQADPVYPTVSEIHNYWTRVCHINSTANFTRNITEPRAQNVTMNKITTGLKERPGLNSSTAVPLNLETTIASSLNVTVNNSTTDDCSERMLDNLLNKTLSKGSNSSTENLPLVVQVSTLDSSSRNSSVQYGNLTLSGFNNATINAMQNTTFNSSTSNSSFCEILNCSWIEMCMPSVDTVDRCNKTACPFTRKSHRSCLRVKMCKSPSTPISVFATINTTISQIDQFETITRTVSDFANLTLISYIPPLILANCSRNSSEPTCKPPDSLLPISSLHPNNATVSSINGTSSASSNTTTWAHQVFTPGGTNFTTVNLTTTELPSSTSIPI
ncbi:uncharacterized protein LOC124368005 isoform X2 [Homalodisca vitripennis]|uniref:uncharacterized protein LOC124368005 isoform X2 n=1 Tax=Homalodisca vitripennis TaxID=197043 RepID=UPI001EEA7FEE|nr:uncharacterized protein LOC124368005 isoform X2 [Homalodisca vitripennis]